MATNSFQQQVVNVAEDLTQSVTVPILRFLWSWIKRIVPLFVVLSVLLAILLSCYSVYRQQRDRQLKFIVGPPGTGDAEQLEEIEQRMRQQRGFWGPNYFVTEISEGGSISNLQNVNRDQDGNLACFATEATELEDQSNLRTLVPLEWCYLHFVFRIDSLANIDKSLKPHIKVGESIQPVKLSDWAVAYCRKLAEYKKGTSTLKGWPLRLYLGPPNSATQHIARFVLQNAGVPVPDLEQTGISDFKEMQVALKRNHIDGAFFVGPIKSPLIEEIAADKEVPCTLVSLDVVHDVLSANHFIQESVIHPYSYSFGDDGSHLGEVNSLAMRRVLVASSMMTNDDAFYLAGHVRAALASHAVALPKENLWSDPDGKYSVRELNYEMHPGVDLDTEQGPGFNWLSRHMSWLGPLLLAMTISLATELKTRIPLWLAGNQPPAPPKDDNAVKDQKPPPAAPAAGQAQPSDSSSKERPMGYAEIESQLDALYDELMVAYDRIEKPSKTEMTAWKERLDLLIRHVRPLRRDGKLSRNDVEALLGTASKLQQILVFLHEPASAASAAASGTTGNAGDDRGKSGKPPK